MKNILPTITIGVAAWNEEDNIGNLLSDLSNQHSDKVLIENIIICSDASTDRTENIVSKLKNNKIKLIRHKERKGKAEGINSIISHTKTDVLVILDADIRIPDTNFIEKLAIPIIKDKVDLTSANQKYSTPKTYFEKLLSINMDIKSEVFAEYKDGNNFFTCHGQARGFSKKLYSKIIFPFSVGEDMFSYIFCQVNDFKYKYVSAAVAMYKLPDNMVDHEKQSLRFLKSTPLVIDHFTDTNVDEYLAIPWLIVVKKTLKYFLMYPIEVLFLNIIFAYIKFKNIIIKNIRNDWDKVESSKINISNDN